MKQKWNTFKRCPAEDVRTDYLMMWVAVESKKRFDSAVMLAITSKTDYDTTVTLTITSKTDYDTMAPPAITSKRIFDVVVTLEIALAALKVIFEAMRNLP